MKSFLRSLAKELTPRVVVQGVQGTLTSFQRIKLPSTRTAFDHAGTLPDYLGMSDLELLQKKYPLLPDYGYDLRSLDKRGMSRAREILRLPGASTATPYLELGCWDGMVSCHLQRLGKRTTAIDIQDEGFDTRARRGGVTLLKMDAADLQFPNESFDCVFSYDAFEHFPNPEGVLQNARRVLKTGGHLFLTFGPLYMSPFGQHAYRTITVPYCQFLFPSSLLQEFATARALEPVNFEFVNGWSCKHYRRLWEEYSSSLGMVRYSETLNLEHLDLIKAYPTCFKNKTDWFDNLIVESITAVFKKIS